MHVDDALSAPFPILLIHCADGICNLVREVLGWEGYDVRAAVFGRGALRMLREMPPHTILFVEPLALSVVGNEELRSYITDPKQRGRHVVFVMTSQVNIEAYAQVMHFDGSLAMPFFPEELLAAVESAQRLARQKQNRPTIH